MKIKIDRTGQKFNKLIFIKETEQRLKGNIIWELLCDCGDTCYSIACYVTNGSKKHCGHDRHIINDRTGQNIINLLL